MGIIYTQNLNLSYGNNHVLHDINMEIEENRITALIGPFGCGKSTFLKTLNRMNDLIAGCKISGLVSFNGCDIYDRKTDPMAVRKKIGMVFQKPNSFPISIYDNVAYAPRYHGTHRKKKLDEATSALDPISTAKMEELMVELKNSIQSSLSHIICSRHPVSPTAPHFSFSETSLNTVTPSRYSAHPSRKKPKPMSADNLADGRQGSVCVTIILVISAVLCYTIG